MANIVIRKTEQLKGEIEAPPSKSYTHRMLVAALLSDGITRIQKPLISDDTLATLEAIKALGATVEKREDFWEVKGHFPLKTPERPINCRESGATLRFMIPVAALAPGTTTFVMKPSLGKRPITPLLESLLRLGVKTQFVAEPLPKVIVYGGGILGGKTLIRGDISSQFISGLLFACPLAQNATEIYVTSSIESESYIEMTIEVLERHSIKISASKNLSRFHIPNNQIYRPANHVVPGDFSSAAYIFAAAVVTSSRIRIKNLDPKTKQGDRAILNILKNAGVKISVTRAHVEVGGNLKRAIEVDARDTPDLVPTCTAIACYANGTSRIYHAKRLRYKESDRLAALYTEFKKMGADIKVEGDSLIINGPCKLGGAKINPHNDHRIAMACATAALGAEGETLITNAECVEKSYPTFFRDLRLLGANIIGDKLDW